MTTALLERPNRQISGEMLLAPYLGAIVRQQVKSGHDAQDLLRGTGLSEAALAQEDLRVPESTCLMVMSRAREQGWDQGMAWRMGASLDLGSHGFLGYAVLASATLGDALALGVRYFRTRTSLLSVSHFIDDDQSVLQVEEGTPLNGLFPWLMDALMASMLRSCEQLFGAPPPTPCQVRLSYHPGAHHEELLALLDDRVEFDAGFTQVRFPVHWLASKLGSADPNLVRLAEVQCQKALKEMSESEGLLGRVRDLAREFLHETRSLDCVADALHVAPRTLRRRLQAQGTSYQAIVEELRHAMAVDKLLHTPLSVEDIAEQLGYRDPSNFGRAFRRWTGESPRGFRQRRRRVR